MLANGFQMARNFLVAVNVAMLLCSIGHLWLTVISDFSSVSITISIIWVFLQLFVVERLNSRTCHVGIRNMQRIKRKKQLLFKQLQ